MKKNYILLFCLLTFLSSFSQNDLCENAIPVTPAEGCSFIAGTFSGATISTAAPSCAPNSSQDVWYSFVATQPTMSIRLSISSNLNSGFQVLQNDCAGTSLACVNNTGISFGEFYSNNNFVVGQTYLIRVLNVNTSISTATFGICVQNYPTPINDLCTNAISLTPSTTCNFVSGTFSGATISSPTSSCTGNIQQDVWYQFVATEETLQISASPINSVNIAIEVLNNNCTGTNFSCANAFTGSLTETVFSQNFIIGNTYFIRVFNADNNLQTADFNVCVRSFPRPANDFCSNATILTANATCINTIGTFSGSEFATPISSCTGNIQQDVWYQFVATEETLQISASPINSVNIGIEILNNNCTGTNFSCANAFTGSLTETVFSQNFIIGNTYFIRVFNADNNLQTANFNVCVRSFPRPTNDFCSNATILTANATCINTIGTFSGSEFATPTSSCTGNIQQDVWYQFVATGETIQISASPINSVNIAIEVLNNNCTGTNFSCANAFTGSLTETVFSQNFIIGNTYFIRVFNADNNLQTANFNICIINQSLSTNQFEKPMYVIHPNPADNIINIETSETIKEIEIINCLGKEVIKSKSSNSVDVSTLAQGIYLVKIITDNDKVFITKLLKN